MKVLRHILALGAMLGLATGAENDLLLKLRDADGGQKPWDLALTPGATLVGGEDNVPEVRILPGQTATTSAQVLAAAANGGVVNVCGAIGLDGPLVITVDNTELVGVSDGHQKAALIRAHSATEERWVIKVAAKNVKIRRLDLTTNHPLVSDIGVLDTGVLLASEDGIDVSGLVVEDCEIHHVMNPVRRGNSATSTVAQGVSITRNYLHSFGYGGIYIESNVCAEITRNRIFGRVSGETHPVAWNGIWFGNFGDFSHIHENEIAFCGRHGIEYWNSQAAPVNTGGNRCGKITRNNLHDPIRNVLVGNFGISAFGAGSVHVEDNSVQGDWNIGIETYNDRVNDGTTICTGNFIELQTTAGGAVGVSVNDVTNGIYSDNTLGRIVGAPGWDASGFHLINGGQNISIRNNKLKDAGNKMILLDGYRRTITAISKAANAAVTTSTAHQLYTGRLVHFSGISGMTEMNDLDGQVTVTGPTTFTVNINSAGFSTYSSGGLLQNTWNRINIENNSFDSTEILNGAAVTRAIWLYDLQTAVVRNNTSWVKTGVSAGAMTVINSGTVYVSDSGDPPVSTSSGELSLEGTNLTINY